MRFSQLGSAVALGASVSHAFLLPPTVSSATVGDGPFGILPFDAVIPMDGRTALVACPGCPVNIKDISGKVNAVTTQTESMLRLDFAVVHGQGSESDKLTLNGIQLYPHDPAAPEMRTLTADQLVKSPRETWDFVDTPHLGWGFRGVRAKVVEAGEQFELLDVNIDIFNVVGKSISGIPSVELKLIETASGKYMIADMKISKTSSGISGAEQGCNTLMCQWRAIIASKLSKLKGCGGKAKGTTTDGNLAASKPSHSNHEQGHPQGNHHGGRPHPHWPRPNGAKPHGSHRHHPHRHGGLTRFVRGVIFHIFVPILIGVVVGVAASIMGMIVGQLAILLWRTLFRRGFQQVQQTATDEECKSFVEHQSPPPVYEDLPVYGDAPAYEEVVVNEKNIQ